MAPAVATAGAIAEAVAAPAAVVEAPAAMQTAAAAQPAALVEAAVAAAVSMKRHATSSVQMPAMEAYPRLKLQTERWLANAWMAMA